MTEQELKEFVTFKGKKIFVEDGLLSFVDEGFGDLNEVEGISSLKTVKKIHLYDCAINNVDAIAYLTDLEEFTAVNPHTDGCILSPKDLTAFKNLKALNLANCNMKHIEGLENFEKLEKLGLEANGITKITGLDSLVNLEELDLNSNEITKIEGLDKLVNLRVLRLAYTKITKIEGVDNLENLEYIGLSCSKLASLGGLENLKQFVKIDYKFTPLKPKA